MAKNAEGRGRKFLIFLGFVLSVLILGCVLLFVVNRFAMEIDLTGEKEITLSAGDDFTDPGSEAFAFGSLLFRERFPVDAEVTVRGDVNTAVPGTYEIVYDASWHWLTASEKRIVTVRDTQAPMIQLEYVPGACTLPGEEYAEEGYSAWDDCDGDLTARVVREIGDGIVTYTVTDQAGNETSVSREICCEDTIAPELILTEGDTVYLLAGEEFVDPGWTVIDNHDGDLSNLVQVVGTIDKYLAGEYTFTYTVSDASGNVTEVTRTVVMQPHPMPETVIPEEKVIYLTFDDGPSYYTPRLLEVLEKYGAKATFFVCDTGYIDTLKDIAEGGHSIGIHSVEHNYREIYSSPEAYFHDILTMQQIIYEQTGIMTYLMRFPGGSNNTVSCYNPGIMTYLTQAVEDNGFRYFDWNVDSLDAGGAQGSQDVLKNVRSGVSYYGTYAVVLQHDTCAFSVSAVEQILIWGIANGYEFRGLDMTSPTVHFEVNN